MTDIIATKSVTNAIDTDYKEYAKYVLENRAIPCYIDGQKPVTRKLLYAMLNQHKGKKTKISDLGGISSIGYNHGEASAMGAAINMAADWSNNVPVFQQHGSFGSRLIPEAAAPRYIYASLNETFYKYFTDFDVLDPRPDIEDPEPRTYLPNIPWVLVNGIKGIAVGFACEYLPHDPADIAKACKLALSNRLKDDTILTPSFPGFFGTVEAETHNKFITTGKVERVKRNTWEISELPWGVNREKYFNQLVKMELEGLIQDFDDNCSDTFNFTIKVNTKQDAEIQKDPIKYFKLQKSYTENYTALDENGSLVLFETKIEIIKKFVTFRLKKIQDQLDYEISKCEKELYWLNAKLSFVKDVLDEKISFKTTTRKQLTDHCIKAYNIDSGTATRLVNISIVDITKDMVSQLEDKIDTVTKTKTEFEQSDSKQILVKRLDDIIKNSKKWNKSD